MQLFPLSNTTHHMKIYCNSRYLGVPYSALQISHKYTGVFYIRVVSPFSKLNIFKLSGKSGIFFHTHTGDAITDVSVLSFRHSVKSNAFVTPRTAARQAPLSMGFSRQDTGVGCHSLLQGIFLSQGPNLGLLNCRQILYCLRHQGSP